MRKYKKIPKPSYYTTYEGGALHPWKLGDITHDDLVLGEVGRTRVIVKGRMVHSIIFGEVVAGLGSFARWDCINGWTDTPFKKDITY